MTTADALLHSGRLPLLEAHDPEAHPSAEVLCDRLRRLDQLRAALAACTSPEELDAAAERALAVVPARFARLVEVQEGGVVVAVAAWPAAARGLATSGAPGEAAIAARAPVWIAPAEAAGPCAPRIPDDAARLGVEAWGAVPVCAGAVPAALELALGPAPRLDATERGYLAVAAGLLGGAALRARLTRAAEEGDLVTRMRRHALEMNAVLDAFSVGVALISSSGEILAMNRAAKDLFDLGDDPPRLAPELLARKQMTWPDGRLVAIEETPFRRALRGELVRDVLLSFASRGEGQRWMVVGAAPLGPPGAVHSVVLNMVDVTRSRELEQERASLLRHLVNELGPPLRTTVSRAEKIRDGARTVEEASERAAEIVRAGRRVGAGLREIEAALRFDADSLRASPELVDVKAFLLDVLERVSAEVDASRVIPVIPPGLPRARVDPDHLERIVVELLRGALAGAPDLTDVALAAEAERDFVRLTVASTGQDIAAADLPRIFDRFFKSRGRPVGRLHVVRSLAEANGGRVSAESGAGRGLAIHVLLPLRAR